MPRLLDQILVVDVESTCWDGQPPPDQISEIIEIGLCAVDVATLTRVERRSILVRPARLDGQPLLHAIDHADPSRGRCRHPPGRGLPAAQPGLPIRPTAVGELRRLRPPAVRAQLHDLRNSLSVRPWPSERQNAGRCHPRMDTRARHERGAASPGSSPGRHASPRRRRCMEHRWPVVRVLLGRLRGSRQ